MYQLGTGGFNSDLFTEQCIDWLVYCFLQERTKAVIKQHGKSVLYVSVEFMPLLKSLPVRNSPVFPCSQPVLLQMVGTHAGA